MPKEKSYNPVQAQRKADKARAIKKGGQSPEPRDVAGTRDSPPMHTGKAEVQERRNERLARRNPDRIQSQIDELKAVTAKGGKLSNRQEQVLEGLEKELRAVRKARDALGDEAPTFGPRREGENAQHGVLGKRSRGPDSRLSSSSGSSDDSDDDVPEDVRNIPMPRDTPPPIPKSVLDAWYARRRARRDAKNAARQESRGGPAAPADAPARPEAPAVEHKTVYEAKPVMRNLRQEAVSAFVPAAVQAKMAKSRGRAGLMEPDEADQLEKEGYLGSARAATVEEADQE